jgi:hypothetical protein
LPLNEKDSLLHAPMMKSSASSNRSRLSSIGIA